MAMECGTCGEKIRLIVTPEGRSIVCNSKPVRFNPGGGPHHFITADGKTVYGEKRIDGTEKGYLRYSHRKEAG